MSYTEKKAIVKATGKTVTVYRHREGDWVDSSDLDTRYAKNELEFLKG